MIKLLLNLLLLFSVIAASFAQTPVLHLKYNEPDGTSSTTDAISGRVFDLPNNFGKAERLPGIEGNALRTDGYSTFAAGIFNNDLGSQVTVETWLALESYPSDLEKPYAELTPSAIISQSHGELGFQIGINTFGKYWFSANINGVRYTCQAMTTFPLYEWSHIAGVIDGTNSIMQLYLNGELVASVAIPAGGQLSEAGTDIPFVIGKSNHNLWEGPFLLNALSGAFDQTKVYAVARTQAALAAEYANGISNASTTGFQAIAVTANRFQTEIQRPQYHAMPPANWTNEPHGLVLHNGQYHMFYQRTPNGPFKTMMHWGHMVSSDLVHWTHVKDALWPTLEWSATAGYDMKGIWSGDVVVDGGVAHAFYTNVNHTGPFNPGIAHAISSDANFESWSKLGPVIDRPGDVADFRDPYLWKEDGVWKMIIGASINGHGGLDYYTSADLHSWTRQGTFAPFAAMDATIGSGIWEMPVFESIGNGKHVLIVNPIGGEVSKHGYHNGQYNGKYTRGVYWIGTWNGSSFTPDFTEPKRLDLIHGHLSPSVTRKADGKLVGIGIVDERRNAESQRDAGWAHTFSLPRVYSLMPDNRTLAQAPDPALQSLRVTGSQQSLTNLSVNGTQPIAPRGKTMEIIVNIDPFATGTKYGINFFVSDDRSEITRLWYDVSANKLVLDKRNSSKADYNEWEEKAEFVVDYDLAAFGKPKKIHIFLDNSIIDVFINDAAAFSNRLYPTMSNSDRLELFSEGTTQFNSVDVWGASTTAQPIKVTGLSLNKTSAVVPLNSTEALLATVMPFTAENKSITWTSSNTAVATVSTAGVVTPKSLGNTTITATTQDGNFNATCVVSVIGAVSYKIIDFEAGDLRDFPVKSGTAFTDGDITTDATFWDGIPFGHQGSRHFWGAKNGGDNRTGTMETESFILGGSGKISFMIGGGFDINQVYVALVRKYDDKELMKVTGDNNNSEAYVQKQFEAGAYIGTECIVRVVDNHTGGWGHINIDNVTIPIMINTPIPSPWSTSNIGNVIPVGAVSHSNETFTVNGSGHDIWDGADGFRFVYQQVSGDVTITSHIASQSNVDPWAKAGVMIRENLTAGSPNVATLVTPSNGITFQRRTITNEITEGTTTPGLVAPYWVRMVKSGNSFTSFHSSDGITWTQLGSVNISMGSSVYVGLAVTSHNNNLAGTVTFSNVNVTTSIPVTGVSLNKTSTSLVEGSTETFVATVNPGDATNKSVTWKSSNTSVATVDSSGVVTAVAPGISTVTVTTQDGGFTAEASVTVVAQQYLVYDFESGNLSGWTGITGTAFTDGDVTSDQDFWGGAFNQQGTYHYWGAKNGGDSRTGSMRTQDFVIGGNGIISFIIGGGFDINQVYIALVRTSDNVELMKATGDNNDSEAYTQKQFDASAFIGTECYIKVVDNHTGGWGHINLDNLRIPVISISSETSMSSSQVEVMDSQPLFKSKIYNLYPNPVHDNYFYFETGHIEGIRSLKFTIVNVTGQLMEYADLEYLSDNIVKFHCDFPEGIYIIRAQQDKEIFYKKIIIQRR